jgi:carbamoyl-phosphate synthase large subunit
LLSVGFDWVDAAYILPDCRHADQYIDAMMEICQREQVDLVLPGSEGEIRVLSEYAARPSSEAVVRLIVPPPSVLDVCFDKLETCRFLDMNGLHGPRYAGLSDTAAINKLVHDQGFPLLAKPCRGSGSQGIFRVQSELDLDYIRSLGREYVIQEYLVPDEEEYTVGVFTDSRGNQNDGICMRRELAAGNTYRAWVTDHAAVLAEASRVVEKLGIVGPCNVQIRVTARGPIPFEVNPRFSGTTGMRAHFGYNEVEMAIRSFVLNEPLPPPSLVYGTALRYWEEVYLPTTDRGFPVLTLS